jgi:shikimate kinase
VEFEKGEFLDAEGIVVATGGGVVEVGNVSQMIQNSDRRKFEILLYNTATTVANNVSRA